MTNISEQIAKSLQAMDPTAAQSYLDDLKRDVLRAADGEAIAKEARLKSLREISEDDLTAQIANYDVRTGDRQEQQERMAALKELQNLKHDLSKVTTMPAAEAEALTAQRKALTDEAANLRGLPGVGKGGRPSAARLRQQEIARELASLPGAPDVVLPEPVQEG